MGRHGAVVILIMSVKAHDMIELVDLARTGQASAEKSKREKIKNDMLVGLEGLKDKHLNMMKKLLLAKSLFYARGHGFLLYRSKGVGRGRVCEDLHKRNRNRYHIVSANIVRLKESTLITEESIMEDYRRYEEAYNNAKKLDIELGEKLNEWKISLKNEVESSDMCMDERWEHVDVMNGINIIYSFYDLKEKTCVVGLKINKKECVLESKMPVMLENPEGYGISTQQVKNIEKDGDDYRSLSP